MTRYNPNLQIENTPQGRQAVFYAQTDTRHDLAAHAFYEVALPAQAGTLTVALSALDRAHPSDSHVTGPRVDPTADSGMGSVTVTYNLWPVTLILHSPDGQLVHTWKQVAGHSENDTTTFTHEIPSGAGGTWRLRVTNDGAHASLIVVSTSAVSARGPLHTQTLPHRMFDGPLQVILEALSLKTDFEGGTLRLGFGQDLQDFAPGNDELLGFHAIPLPGGLKANGGYHSCGACIDRVY
jgi:hypothetical protein